MRLRENSSTAIDDIFQHDNYKVQPLHKDYKMMRLNF